MSEASLKILNEDPKTINAILKLALHYFPNSIAFRDNQGLSRTFLQLNEDVGKIRSFLKNKGISCGDHVAIVLGNNYDFVKSYLAITTYGCVAVLIPLQMPTNNIENITKLTNCKLIIDSSSLPRTLDLTITSEANINFDTNATIIFTGGTVGKPKTTMLTHGNLCRGAMNGSYGFKNSLGRIYYDLVPFTHVFGLVRNLLTGIVTGSEQFLCLDMKDFVNDLSICKPTILILVPALAELI
jgi:long-chain acyl-CoA synthetase